MEEPLLITTSKRNQPYIWSSDLEEVLWNHLSELLLESTNAINLSVEFATLETTPKQLIAGRKNVDTPTNLDQRKRVSGLDLL